MDAGHRESWVIMAVWVLTVIMIVGLIVAFAVIHA